MPCTISETLSTRLWVPPGISTVSCPNIYSSLDDAFTSLGKPSEIYLAITSEDASIVYYKISSGVVKPSIWLCILPLWLSINSFAHTLHIIHLLWNIHVLQQDKNSEYKKIRITSSTYSCVETGFGWLELHFLSCQLGRKFACLSVWNHDSSAQEHPAFTRSWG